MDLPTAGQLAQTLMAEHGLTAAGWTFRFNQRKRALGLCNFTARRVELSAPFTVRNDEPEVRDVLLHEIAHALTPPAPGSFRSAARMKKGSGTSVPVSANPPLLPTQSPKSSGGPHGPAWRAMCLKIGANPHRLNTTAAAPPGKWQAVCPGCQTTHHRHRKPAKGRTYICRSCGPQRGVLRFTRAATAAACPGDAR